MAVKLMPVATAAGAPEPKLPADVEKPRGPRKRRRAAVYDADGNEVLITLKCLKCGRMHPLSNFGLRRMADGAIRNQPWCRECRGASSPKKKKLEAPPEAEEPVEQPVQVAEPAPGVYSGPMQVVPLTAEQVLRALAPQGPRAEPAVIDTPEPASPAASDEPKPE